MNEKDNVTKLIQNIVNEVMSNMNSEKMTLSLALELTEKVKQKASSMGVNAVVAVTDAGANTVSVQSMDNAYIASYDIALNKAFTVVSLKMPTSTLKTLAAPGGSLYGIQFTNNGRIVIFGGGEPLYNKNGEIIGGLGVSGGTEEQDTELGRFGAEVFKTLL